ncbi:MAG: valine--tRNA ligase [Longimicrobiaceae bacterium]
MSEPLPPQYLPGEVEAPLYRWWEEQGYFHARADSRREPYTIVIPPPNVTAVLHMGHGLNNTIQDVLIRWRRMQGREALWLPGTDHAGIATQNVVERQLAVEASTRDDLGRDAFVQRVWTFVQETGSTILEQLRAIGCSCDWERTRFTLDPGLSRAVREVFVRLYEKGLIYRGEYIINWCPRCLTALSNEEAEPEKEPGKLYHVRYPVADPPADSGLPTLADGRPYLEVATTRPETMLGDTAVAVHPTDGRYSHLVGGELELPLTGRRIPIVSDEAVDPDFGTGAVKVTPAHDANDFEIAQRAGLPAIDIFTPAARTNREVPGAYRDLDRFEARARVVDDLQKEGLLAEIEDHPHAVPHCYRCGTVVEPRLSEQWFVRMRPLAEPALAASRDGRVRFTPERWTKVYEHWMENIRDWCISRQLWWGHRIPVWYCGDCGEMIVARNDPSACPACGGAQLEQDPDVLDTWFSSWLWPFSTLGWPEETEDLKTFYPTQTLSTAPEILFFWVARMIMAGIEFMGEAPFSDVYLHSTVRDIRGTKMSKSLGNVIDPLEVVDLYGADALRYTLIAAAGVGTDVSLNPQNLEEAFAPGRNFANKLWNIGRFTLPHLEAGAPSLAEVQDALELPDRWILSRLATATEEASRALESFRFHGHAETVYHFFWSDLADWYLELVKPRLGEDAGGSGRAARATLRHVLDGGLRLLHPIMPFITEALWQRMPRQEGEAESLMMAAWPDAGEWRSPAAEAGMAGLQEVIGAVRNLRAEYGVRPGTRIPLRVRGGTPALRESLVASGPALRELARVEEVSFAAADGEPGATAVLTSGAELFLPLAGVVDLGREIERLDRERERLEGLLRASEGKLGNAAFVDRAPPEVVQREREKLVNLTEQRDKVASKLAALREA